MTTASRTASAYSVERELDGELSVFPFDEYGRPIPSHPFTRARFHGVGAALDALAACAACAACAPCAAASPRSVPNQGLVG